MFALRTILPISVLAAGLVFGSGLPAQKAEQPSAPATTKPGAAQTVKPTPGGAGEDPVSSSSPMKLLTPETEALTEFEKRTRFLVKKAEYHYFNKRFYTALRFLKQLKEHDPENYLAYAYSGDIRLTHNELDKALADYRVALELSPEPARERFRIGQIYYLKEEPREALRHFNRALKNKPDFPLCQLYIGLVYLNQLQDKPKAIQHLTAYRDAAPNDPQAAQVAKLLKTLQGPQAAPAAPAKPAAAAKPAQN